MGSATAKALRYGPCNEMTQLVICRRASALGPDVYSESAQWPNFQLSPRNKSWRRHWCWNL